MRRILKTLIILTLLNGNGVFGQTPFLSFIEELDQIQTISTLYPNNGFKSQNKFFELNLNSQYNAADGYFQYVGRLWNNNPTKEATEIVFYLTLSNLDSIFYREAYVLNFDETGENPTYETIHIEIDSLKFDNFKNQFFEVNYTEFKLSYLDRIPAIGGDRFGFACGYNGSMPELGQKMMSWLETKNIKELENWSYTLNAEKQAYAYTALCRLKELGDITYQDLRSLHLKRIEENRTTLVNSCEGCGGTISGHPETLGELVSSDRVRFFIYGL